MKKVSLAEQITDISDSENAKKTRKSRARRIPSSSEESENEKHPPKKRFKNIRSAAKKKLNSTFNIQSFLQPLASSDHHLLTLKMVIVYLQLIIYK